MPSSLIAPAIGAVIGGIGGKKSKRGAPAPTTFETLPKELQDFSKDNIFPRLEELFNRPAEVSPKKRAISPTADPLFASSALFDLQRFADQNQGRTTVAPPEVVEEAPVEMDGLTLAEEFIKGLGNTQTQAAPRGQFLSRGLFTGDLGQQLSSFGDLETLSQALSDQGFSKTSAVNPQTLQGLDLMSLIRAAQGVL